MAATGYRVYCPTCDVHTFYTVEEARSMADRLRENMGAYLLCCRCERRRVSKVVVGKRGKRKCGPWCTEGTGLNCTCMCGGVNHGSAYPAGILWALH